MDILDKGGFKEPIDDLLDLLIFLEMRISDAEGALNADELKHQPDYLQTELPVQTPMDSKLKESLHDLKTHLDAIAELNPNDLRGSGELKLKIDKELGKISQQHGEESKVSKQEEKNPKLLLISTLSKKILKY